MAKKSAKPSKKATTAAAKRPAARPSGGAMRRAGAARTSRAAATAPAPDVAVPHVVRRDLPRSRPQAVETVQSRGKYVYCIIRSPEPLHFGAIGIGTEPSEVQTVHFRDLAAVASDTPIAALDPTRDNVLAHQRVNETVMRDHTVIPMSFGTVFKTKDDITELLRSAYDAFSDVLNKMHDKVEFGLKVLWDRDLVVRELENEDEDIRRLKNEISSQTGSTYFARMQYGRMIDAALQSRSERYVSEIFESLRNVSVASRSNKPIGDKMIMNAAFLVARDHEGAFDAKVKEIGQRLDKLTFKYTGPWPPYNFVNIRLKLDRAQ
jgi:hypothetical protein